MQDVPDIIIFLGRFHPLVVHLPIGILSLAILAELFFNRGKEESLRSILLFVWLTGVVSSLMAAIVGYMLSLGGGYYEDTLVYHMWFGFSLSFLVLIFYFLKRIDYFSNNASGRYTKMFLLGSIGFIMFATGHLGGSLTHGEDYLFEFAPTYVQQVAGITPKSDKYITQVLSVDSAYIFENAIQPILNARCTSCHNKTKKKGNLILTSYDEVMRGGDSGPAVVSGNLMTSELFRRITLPQEDEDFMPSEGKKPLTLQQIAIIEWWIEKEAPRKTMLATLNLDEDIRQVFELFFGLGKFKKEELNIPPADTSILHKIVQNGFIVRQLSRETNQLSVSMLPGNSNTEGMSLLPLLKDQITWLHLSDLQLQDADMEIIAALTNLTKLNISKNPITDEGIRKLISLPHIEYLNLYETHISESVLTDISGMKNLKELYLWNTVISKQAVDTLKMNWPNIKIIYQ